MIKFSLAALVLILAACADSSGSRQATEFDLVNLAGGTVSLSSLRGKPVLVNFWATWCDTCREEMPDIEALFRRSGGRFSVIGLSMDDDADTAVPPFVKKHQLTFPMLVADREVAAAYAVRGLPATFLIDGEGRIARRWVGPLDVRAAETDILAMLNGQSR